MFACRKASFCWLQKNCTVQWVARYLHGYLEFAQSLFTLDWRLHLSINEYVSYTAVKRTKFSFQWYKDLHIRWFANKLWSEEEVPSEVHIGWFSLKLWEVLSIECGPNTYQIMYEEALEFQCHSIRNGNIKCPVGKSIFALNLRYNFSLLPLLALTLKV